MCHFNGIYVKQVKPLPKQKYDKKKDHGSSKMYSKFIGYIVVIAP